MKRLRARVALMLAIAWLAVPALPQALALRVSAEIEESTPWRQWIATVVLFGLWVIVFFKNSKRSHQN